MADLDLGKQVGPLPLGAWLVVVAGGLGIAWYTKNNSTAAPEVVDDVSSPPGVGDGTNTGWSPTYPSATSPNNPIAPPTTNDEWAYRATQYLISIGTASATAQSATSKYIAEQQLSVTEFSMISLALIAIGPLPIPLTNAGGTNPPPAKPTMTAPKNVKATSVGRTTIDINWDPVPGAVGYRVWANGRQNGGAIVFSQGTARYLKPNTKYSIGVSALSPDNKNGPTTTITVQTKK